jgi:hypothetical protein
MRAVVDTGTNRTTRTTEPTDVAEGAGRLGLATRGAIYLLVAVLAAQVALGQRSEEADQRGALAELADRSFGWVALLVLAAGFAGYAAWRLVRAIKGEEPGEPDATHRLADVGRAAVHVGLFVSCVGVLRGDRGGEDATRTWTERLMADGWGRWVVGAAGLVLVGYGAWQVYRAVSGRFRKHLERRSPWVLRLGVVGHLGRGLAFGIIGGFVVRAAVRFDPAEPVGLDAALHDLAGSSAGRLVVLVVAIGLAAFGLFSMAEARDRRVLSGALPPSTP